MEIFNENSFSALLTRCYENEGYKGVVLLHSEAEKRDFTQELVRYHQENPITGVSSIVTQTLHTYDPIFMEFENDSKIEFITLNDLRRIRGHRFNEALLDNEILDFDAIEFLGSLIFDYDSDINQNILRRRRNRTSFADRINNYERHAMGVWDTPKNSDIEIEVDRESKEVLDDFLDSFKIHNSLEFGT